MSEKQIKKIILAYSGGLDTTVILHWLKDQYDAEVIAFTADIGQDHDPELVRDRAASIGASKIIIEDLKEEFTKEYIFPMFKANTLYEETVRNIVQHELGSDRLNVHSTQAQHPGGSRQIKPTPPPRRVAELKHR